VISFEFFGIFQNQFHQAF